MAGPGGRRRRIKSGHTAVKVDTAAVEMTSAPPRRGHPGGERPLAPALKARTILDGLDYTADEMHHLLDLAAALKGAKRAGTEEQHLRTKEICVIFEETPSRKRCAFEVAAHDQGAHVTFLDPSEAKIGREESIRDTARVLGRLYHGIDYPGCDPDAVVAFAEHAGVPVWNGLTAEFHPTEILADIVTMREHSAKRLEEIACAFLGDVAGTTGTTLLIGGAKLGMDVRLVGPRDRWPSDALVEDVRAIAIETGARVTVTDSIPEGVAGSDFVYTEAWVSAGQSKETWVERVRLLRPYRVDADVIAATGHPATKFMHRLPAFHNAESESGAELAAVFGISHLEVTDDVFESPASIVFDQAENRMHTIKAILVATMGE